MDSERIILGSGKLYCMVFTGEIPEDTAIETDTNQLAHIKGGASLEYTAETYTAKKYIKQCCHLWLKSYLTIKTGSGLQQSIWKAKSTTLRKSWHTLTIMAILSIRLRITQIKNAVLSGRRQRGRGAL